MKHKHGSNRNTSFFFKDFSRTKLDFEGRPKWNALLCYTMYMHTNAINSMRTVCMCMHVCILVWCTYCTCRLSLPRFPTWSRFANKQKIIPKNMTVFLLYPQIQGPSKAFIYTGSADHVKAAKRQVWYFTNEVIAVTHENVVPQSEKCSWSILYMAVFGKYIIINLINTN